MTETKKRSTGATIRVRALPDMSTWPARNAEKKFGISVADCRKLKRDHAVELLGNVAEKLIQAKLVAAYPESKGGK